MTDPPDDDLSHTERGTAMRLPWLRDFLKERLRRRRKPILTVPFVGREDVLTTLDVRLREATAGGQVFVALEGPAGNGKSALLEEFLARRCRSAAVLSLMVNAADCLLAEDVFASLLVALERRTRQITEQLFRDTRRLRSLKGLNSDEAEFTRMIAGRNIAQTSRRMAPLASLSARVRQHPWATGAAVALDGLQRTPEEVPLEPQQLFVDLTGSMRDHIEPGKAVMVVVIDQVDGAQDVPDDAASTEPDQLAWGPLAKALIGARMPSLVVWAGPAEGVGPVRESLPAEARLTTCAVDPLAGREWEHLRHQVSRCMPAALRAPWQEALNAGSNGRSAAWLFMAAAAAVAEDSGSQAPQDLLRDDVEALVSRIVRRIARDHPDAASLWDELLDTWAFLPPSRQLGVEEIMIRCADDASKPDPALLRTSLEKLLGESVRYGLLHHDPYSKHYITGCTEIQASLQAFVHPEPATRRQWSRIRRLAAAIITRAHEGQRARLAAIQDIVGASAQDDDDQWNRALLTPFHRLLETCRIDERQRMAKALGGFSSPLAVALLRIMLRDAEGRVRSAAVQSLADLTSPQATGVLIEALADANSDVRWIATRALGDLSGATAVNALIPMLTDEDNEVGRVAAEALGHQADPRAVPHLIAALRESYPLLRVSAALALGHLADARALPALRDMLKDENLQVRQSAESALERLNVS